MTVPGCVDGWLALHSRFGRLPFADVLTAAISYAEDGFPASPLLAWSAPLVSWLPGGEDLRGATHPGAPIRRPGVARALRAISEGGRDAFYLGEFGRGLLRLGMGEFTEADLAEPAASWVEPLQLDAWDHTLWTVPPNSQGYLTLAGAWIAAGLDLPSDPDEASWAHLLIESARQAAFDRKAVLHDGADGASLIAPDRLAPRRQAIDPLRAATLPGRLANGDTIALCTVDRDRMGVSLIQSNADGFGAHIAEPSTGIFLHNRGIGFSLDPDHPAGYGPRRRPPHTLCPLVVTDHDGELYMVAGTMGGDSQPQVLLQLLARIVHAGQTAGEAISAPRWVLANPDSASDGFATWNRLGQVEVHLEVGSPAAWTTGLATRGHSVVTSRPGNYGHAHAIICRDGCLEGSSDPRSLAGAAAGF